MNYLKALFIGGIIICLSGFILPGSSEAQMGYGMHHGMWDSAPGDSQYGRWSYCPYCGNRLDGQGDYRGRGEYHRGYGMMGPYDRGMMGPGYGRDYRRFDRPLKKEDAEQAVADMLDRSRNPNLKTGKIEDKDRSFVVDIVTKDGSLVDKMQVDKKTGMMRSIY